MKSTSIIRFAQIVGLAAIASFVHADSAAFSESQSDVETLFLSTTFDVTTTYQFSTTILTDLGPGDHFGGSDYTFSESPNDPLYNDTLAGAKGVSEEELESSSTIKYQIFNPSEFSEDVGLFYGGDLQGSASVSDQATEFAASLQEFDLFDSISNQTKTVGHIDENTLVLADDSKNELIGITNGQFVSPIEVDYVIPGEQTLTITFTAHDYSLAVSDILATPEPTPLLGLAVPVLGLAVRRRKRVH